MASEIRVDAEPGAGRQTKVNIGKGRPSARSGGCRFPVFTTPPKARRYWWRGPPLPRAFTGGPREYQR